MKIGIFTDSYLPYTSGVVRSIETFKEELTNLGHEVYIFAPNYKNCQEENRVFRFASIPSPTNPDFALALPFSLHINSIIKDLHLDLIHAHSPFLLGRVAAKYARKEGIPLVFTYHTLYEEYVHYIPLSGTLKKDLARNLSRDFCNQCDMVIAPTAIIGGYLRKIGVTSNLRKVPTGIKTDRFRNGDSKWLRQLFNISPQDNILLFVGRLGQEKNIGLLLESLSIVKKELKNTNLVLVGGGPQEEELKVQADRLGIGDSVFFAGVLSPDEVTNCYAGSDIFVFSSMSETQGLVIVEAKAAGLPVVAVGANGVTEMVEDGIDGYLTGPESSELANRICYLLKNDGLRREMGDKAREYAENLSAANCTRQLLNCYMELMSNDQIDKYKTIE